MCRQMCIRDSHIPTGIVVSCQNERSQFQNRDMCMKMLAAKLYQIKEREHLEDVYKRQTQPLCLFLAQKKDVRQARDEAYVLQHLFLAGFRKAEMCIRDRIHTTRK